MKIMRAVANESGTGPDKLLLFNFLEERGNQIKHHETQPMFRF